ncbi:hypothetical protein [Geobacter sp.]|nr:hypothetical protein [Geobacter sp.]
MTPLFIGKIEITPTGGIRIVGPLVNTHTGKREEESPDDPF